MKVFFDVLDTLLTEEDTPRPHAREVFLRLKEAGHGVYLWSVATYAAVAADSISGPLYSVGAQALENRLGKVIVT